MKTNKNNSSKQNGFTIVELLIVIVVIGILAAITIVAYSGITARAKTTQALSAADAVTHKAEAFNVEGTSYPPTLASLTQAASTTTYSMPATSVTFTGTLIAAAPATPITVNFYKCGHSGTTTVPATLGGITTQTGIQVGYWDYSASSLSFDIAGQASGSVGTFPVACFLTAS